MMRHLLVPFLILLSAACTDFPELDARVPAADRTAPYPELVPIAPLVAQARTSSPAEAIPASITGRLERLREQARRIRGPVIPEPLRSRMLRAMARRALQ